YLIMQLQKLMVFLISKEKWIERHLNAENWLDDVINYNNILVKGVKIPFSVGEKTHFSSEKVSVASISVLKKLFVENLGSEFIIMFKEISALNSFNYRSVSFKSYKSRWGCCDSKGNIIFNYKLLMLPTELWHCVIVHELCHTVHMNHSRKFYSLVERVMPDYKKINKGLKKYSRICSLY
ncbi:MAG: M48 family metallopeptidase, partial [Candidatus Coproplasma sp.]